MHRIRFFFLIAFTLTLTACGSAQTNSPEPLITPTPFQPQAATATMSDATAPAEASAPSSTPQPVIPPASSAVWAQVADGFSRPVFVTHAGDSRLFVVEQRGMIWILQDGQRLPDPFLDIRSRVNDRGNEQGLLGLAFHPRYTENGYFYLDYTGTGGTTHIVRYQIGEDPNRAEASSEMTLLLIDQPYANHNGGMLAFGPDGYLYIGAGDGGSAGDPQGNGQRLDTLLGKILRIAVDGGEPYSIPPENPYAAGGGRPEIWAFGLRNPWRFAFDSLTGDLYIGDVGQNSIEEIDFQPAGAPGGRNYGWNLREGSSAYAGGTAPDLIEPVAEYDHSMGCSVTGGVVLRDPNLPTWSGVYLYGDYCSGRIWGLRADGSGGWLHAALWSTSFQISSFGMDMDGRVYLVDLNGSIQRLNPAP
ncbi:MAG: PQQ-dependent sugar dehydrogenase [Anaerolineales bacterium]|jgi:glucose/arabinose dehydrogenase